ncbi:hypothetical protein NIES4075_30120 [Tolypothrix sp. NIES-4075]|uniref:hypothetical protein n=1 Tax=Tolypothrix sp. NIES-4075 TaxID=2005459 RepID=UPI000B5CB5E3|nr:hypothetical protein [Tolypothrix sp. NIES-4075]GAX42014.1 hypothetical protein NIES4075_30120 [Tolypothrix sp. NIES-4075]
MENTINTIKESAENTQAIVAQAMEIQDKINQHLKQLSLERLQVVADFVAYLADKESEEATQEFEKIPGLLEKIKKNRETTSEANLVNWKAIRSDV